MASFPFVLPTRVCCGETEVVLASRDSPDPNSDQTNSRASPQQSPCVDKLRAAFINSLEK